MVISRQDDREHRRLRYSIVNAYHYIRALQ
jgi:hypothetical protein